MSSLSTLSSGCRTQAFTAGRMYTSPPAGPGTAPLTSRRFLSLSTRTTSRFWVVTLHIAEMTGHLLAFEDPARCLALADRARRPVRNGVAVGGVLTAEVPALDGACVALTLGYAAHIHASGRLRTARPSFRRRLPALPAGHRHGIPRDRDRPQRSPWQTDQPRACSLGSASLPRW